MTAATQPGQTHAGRRARSLPRGNALDVLLRMRRFKVHSLDVTRELHDRYGPAMLQQLPGLPFRSVHLFGPDANRMVVLDRDENLSAKRSWDLIMGRIFTGGLLLRDGDDHRRHRRIMQPTFHRGPLREFAGRMAPQVAASVDGWARDGGTLRAFPAFKHLTLDLACTIFLGIEIGEGTRELNRAFEAAVAASMSMIRLPIPGFEFDRGLRGRRYMMDLFGGLVAERRAGAGEGRDMLSRLCQAETEDGERYEDAEIVDHMIFLMMAAHDTTTSTLCSLAYELARNPDWQERVREESAALGDAPSLEDLMALEAIELCLKETLRRYPPLSTIPRVSVRDFEWDGWQIPEGSMVIVYPLHTHHMPEWWDEPMRFDPDRFSAARMEHRRHTHSYVPFGGGPHMCLGRRFAELQLRLVTHHMVRRLRFSVAPGYEMPIQQAPISKPLDGLPLEIEAIG